MKDISSIQLKENKIENNQIELKKAIKKSMNEVKAQTWIRFSSEVKNDSCEIINPLEFKKMKNIKNMNLQKY